MDLHVKTPPPTADRWEWITTFLFGDDKGIKKLLKEGHPAATRSILFTLPHTANPRPVTVPSSQVNQTMTFNGP